MNAAAAPAVETKADKFKRLGIKRTNDVLTALRSLGQLANKGNYEYTDEQVKKIIDTVGETLNEVDDAFAGKKTATEGFTL